MDSIMPQLSAPRLVTCMTFVVAVQPAVEPGTTANTRLRTVELQNRSVQRPPSECALSLFPVTLLQSERKSHP
jgi:hypothetical protein